MTPGQVRVLVLLAVLFGIELWIHPAARAWLGHVFSIKHTILPPVG